MENYTSKEYQEAKKAVGVKYSFYIHLTVYVLVNIFFHVMNFINWKDSGEVYWAFWPAFGWGIGLFFHGAAAFKILGFTKWKEEQIRKELEKQRKLREKFNR